MEYIYSDLKRSARIALEYGWGRIYRGLLRKDNDELGQWYIDERAHPKDFWALMCIAHPNIASEHIYVGKTKIKKGIDLIFEYIDQIRIFEKLCEDDDDFEESAWWLHFENQKEQEHDIETTIVSGIECKKCGRTLPDMTMKDHLEGNFNQECPHS